MSVAYFRKVDDGSLSSEVVDSAEYETKRLTETAPVDGSAPKPMYEMIGSAAYQGEGGAPSSVPAAGPIGPTGPTGPTGP